MLYVCRSLFIAILCGSLLFWDFSYKGFQLRSINAAEEIKDSNLAATLTMVATGLIASRLWSYPKKTPDMIAAAVGGAAFIAGEISAYMQFKEQLKEYEDNLQMSENPDQKQIESLEKLLQSYEKAKEVAGQKKGFQLAAAAAFGVAAGIATYQAVTDNSLQTACLTALSTAASAGLTACSAACAASCNVASAVGCANACIAASCTPCSAGVAAATSLITSRILARETPNKSMFAFPKVTGIDASVNSTIIGACSVVPALATMGTPADAACVPYLTGTQATMAWGPQLGFAKNKPGIPSLIEKRFFYVLMSRLIKESKASTFSAPLSMMGIASSVAVAFVLANSITLSNMVDLAILIPTRRAILWAAMAATTALAISATQEVMDKLETNIQKIKAVLARMYKLNPGSFANKPNLLAAIKTKITPKKISSIPLGKASANTNTSVNYDYAKTLPCVTPDEASGKCGDMNGAVQKLQGIDNLPTELRDDFERVTDFGSTINGTNSISSAAIEGSQKLGGQINAINERSKLARKKAWEIINKDSNSKTNPESEVDKFKKEMAKSTSDALAKNNLTLASAGKHFGWSSLNGKSEDKKADESKALSDDSNAVNLAVGQGANAVKKDEKLDFSLGGSAEKEITDVEGLNPKAGGDAPKSIDDYDLGQNIHKDPDSNLFEIISKRYMNSGFKRLLEKKKAEANKAVK